MRRHATTQWLTRRADEHGVLNTWPSLARAATWVVVWVIAIGAVLAPSLPAATDREHVPDEPSSNVRYVGPISRSDHAGFLPPPHDPDTFTIAWLGGSEVKLLGVSVPGAFENRVTSVGGKPLVIDSYNVIAPRLGDMLRAVDTAIDNDADAIVMALNPAWIRTEWSVRDWNSLDVSGLGTFFQQPSTYSWGLAFTSPADVAWRVNRAAFAMVEVQSRLNERAVDEVDRLDLIVDGDVVADPGDPRLPTDPTAFWITRTFGPERVADENERVSAIIEGIGVDQSQAEFFARLLIDKLETAQIPVYLYTTLLNDANLANPDFDAVAREVEQFWADRAAEIDAPLIHIESRLMNRDFDSTGTFNDVVHMNNAGPFADELVDRLCRHWTTINPDWSCG